MSAMFPHPVAAARWSPAPDRHPAFAPVAPTDAAGWLRGPLLANRALFGQVALAATLINLFALATSFFSMTVYNRIVPAGATDSLVALLVGMVIVLVFDFVLRSLRGYFVDVAGQNIDHALGEAIFGRLLGMKLADRRGSHGGVAGTLREYETLREFFASATVTALVDVPFILLFLAVIRAVAGPLVWVPLLAIPVVIGIAWGSQPLLERLAAAGMAQGLDKQGIVVETVAGLETIKASRAAPMLWKRWHGAVTAHADIALRQRLVAAFAVNAAISAQSIVYVATVSWGVFLIASGELTSGALIAASLLSGRCVAPLGQIAGLLTRISHTRSAYRGLDAIMSRPGEASCTSHRRWSRLEGGIAFENVSFRYPGSQRAALDNVSFRIAPGERVAIIGRVGSGKSTIARLVLGLYAADSGTVRIDGSDVRQFHSDQLRANIGAVLQDVMLLSGTLRDNITLGDPAIDEVALLRAARTSGAHDFIGQSAQGYDRLVADRGEGLSGGQRQAIAMARALAAPRSILLFDEPTSAMDVISESALIARLEAELEGRTLVLVTHRQSMLRLATRVIIIDEGRIVSQGLRDDVLESLAVA